MMAATRAAGKQVAAMRSASRSLHSLSVLRQQAESSSSSGSSAGPSSRPRRGARTLPKDGRDVRRVDLVGAPDPVSNIRPMVYAPPDNTVRQRERAAPVATQQQQQPPPSVHPYSAHEFHQTAGGASAVSGLHRRRGGLAVFKRYREYVDHVCDRVEEADMKLRLSKLTTDRTTQRFWRDNNTRFQRDLQLWQKQHDEQQNKQLECGSATPLVEDSAAAAPSPPSALPSPVVDAKTSLALAQTAGLSSESDFYATWLRANAKRNRAYNVLVWRQAFDQVRLGARVSMWHTWLSVLRRLEGRQSS